MPRVNFDDVPDATDFSPLPDGKYLCIAKEIEETTTKAGDDMWKLRFEVVSGEYAGRSIYDNMVFSEKALPRVKGICLNMGIDVSGEVDLEPNDLYNKKVFIEVFEDEYHDKEGTVKKKNTVPFAGYSVVKSNNEVTDDDIPF